MIILKITDGLLHQIRTDLARSHPHAAERVGFLSARPVNFPTSTLLLSVAYHPIPDQRYIDDPYSGARINSQAIREAMQLALDTREGLFHIHSHYGRSIPSFSPMDREETPPIIKSLQAVCPDAPHGMIVINRESLFGLVQMPDEDTLRPVEKIVVVGFPTKLFHEK